MCVNIDSLYSLNFHFLALSGSGNVLENNNITGLTFEGVDPMTERVAWLPVITNGWYFFWGRGERWGKWIGLQLRWRIHASVTHSPKDCKRQFALFNIIVSCFPQTIARNLQLEGTNTERSFDMIKFPMAEVLPCLRKITKKKASFTSLLPV